MTKHKSLSMLPSLLTATALGVVGYGALRLARTVWQRNVDYLSPYTAPLPSNPPLHTPLAKRAVFVIFDGLRCDTALTMPQLMALREQGTAVVARVGQPSLSLPGWTAMMTGAWQEISGVNSNFYTGTPTIDSIVSLAQAQGMTTALIGDRVWQQLFGQHADYGKYVQWQKALGAGHAIPEGYIPGPTGYHDKEGIIRSDEELLAAALETWQNQKPDFMLLHLSAADNFGHGYGGASEEYRNAARDHLDPLFGKLLNLIDLSDTAVVVTSDHGHRDAGGHGGYEEIVLDSPLIMAGAGIKADSQGIGYSGRETQVDIAPTLSALLGLPLPAHNQGRPLTEYLTLSDHDKAAIDLAWCRQQSGFYRLYAERSGSLVPFASGVSLDRLEQDYAQGEYVEVSKASHQAVRTLHAEAREWREERLTLDRVPRIAALAAASLPALALNLWQTAQVRQTERDATPPALRLLAKRPFLSRFTIHSSTFKIISAGLAANLVYRNLYAARGYINSLSTFRTDDKLEEFFRERIADSFASGLASGAALGLTMRQSDAATVAAAVTAATGWSLLVVGGQIAWFYSLWGIDYKWHLPDYRYAFKFYLDIVQFGGYALAALPGIGLALLLSKVTSEED